MALIPRESTEEELAAFERVCEQLAGFDERLQVEWVDGYLTGVLAGPRAIPPDEWMPAMCGDAFDRAFADPDSVAEARAALQARWRVIASQLEPERLLDDPDMIYLTPLMWSITDEERAKLVADGEVSAADDARWAGTGEEWAHGFLDATDDFEADWVVPEEDDGADEGFGELIAAVHALTFDSGSEELAAHIDASFPDGPPTRDDLIDVACAAIQDLRVFWLDHAPRPAQRLVERKPGRNDPCHCGSGLKFKKCHGAAGAADQP